MDLKRIFRNNSYLAGIIQGIVFPLITLAIILPLFRWIVHVTGNNHITDNNGILLLSFVPNFILLRYQMIKMDNEKTGKGLMVISALLIFFFFMFIHNRSFEFPI